MRRHAKAIVAISALLLLTSAIGATLASATAPGVTIDPASEVSYTTAHVSGEVDPAGQLTHYYFGYSTDPENLGWQYGNPQELAADAGPTKVSDDLVGLSPGASYFIQILAINETEETSVSPEPNPSFTTDAVALPSVSIDPVTAITGTAAHFSGKVNPGAPAGNPVAFNVDWHFECTPECPGLAGGAIAADNAEHTVTADATGLEPSLPYEVKLVAINTGGQAESDPETFETDPVAPALRPLFAGSVDSDSAVLAAEVNPRNSPTSYQFQWGVDDAFDHVAPATATTLGATDNFFHVVTAPISDLVQGTTYRYRVIATNTDTSEETVGSPREFATLEISGPPAPCSNEAIRLEQSASELANCRAYEMASPLDKGSRDITPDIINYYASSRAAEDGSAVAYTSFGAFGDPRNAALYNQYRSVRSESGWSTRNINPPNDPGTLNTQNPFTSYLSADLSSSVVRTYSARLPGAALLGGSWPLYLQHFSSAEPTFELLTNPWQPLAPDAHPEESGRSFRFDYAASSADMSAIAFASGRQLTADGPPDLPDDKGANAIYLWHDGELHLASVLPDGTAASEPWAAKGPLFDSSSYQGEHVVSDDGTRVFFHAKAPNALYVREDDSTTRLVSASERAGDDPAAPHEADFEGASADGSAAVFGTSEPLTEDANSNGGRQLYHWDGDAPSGEKLENITGGVGRADVIGASPILSQDASRVYFVATGDPLDDGAVPGQPNLYLWQAQQGVTFIATLSAADAKFWALSRNPDSVGGGIRDARVTPDGNHLAFISRAQLTSHDNGGYQQVYLYDAVEERLHCVSCSNSSTGPDSLADFFTISESYHAQMGPYYLPRNLSADGSRVIFETPGKLVSQDSNGKADVYLWEDDRIHLVSSGRSDDRSHFLDASASGDDIFFTTREQLVGSDVDQHVDVYDARVGGGFASQQLPADCQGDACQGAVSRGPSASTPATPDLVGLGNVKRPRARQCGKNFRKVKAKSRKARCVRKDRSKPKRAKLHHGGSK